MVEFAGYHMPVQYASGIRSEHVHTRSAAGLFDVSHMGQVLIRGAGVVPALEALIPLNLEDMQIGQQGYTLLTNEAGGIRDDLIVCRWAEDTFFLVVNADCKEADIAYLNAELPQLEIVELVDRALLALQGPEAFDVLTPLAPELGQLSFMTGMEADILGYDIYVTRSGYTGEDGFEISVPAAAADTVARKLLEDPRVQLIGLGARDSLRLEAGLCLYGHDMNSDITPVEAGVQWAISPARRDGGARAGGFPGAEVILNQLAAGPDQRRVGLRVNDRAPVREGVVLTDKEGSEIGRVTSGGYGPSVEAPVAMAMVKLEHSQPGTELLAHVRGKPRAVSVCKLPFVERNYVRG